MAEHVEASTGISWRDELPRLDLGDGHGIDVSPGSVLGVRPVGDRGCVGYREADHGRRACPFGNALKPDAVDAQCPACAAADPGRRLARGVITEPGAPYRLYLAWFGGTVVKVGITAVGRGEARLAEQGALSYTFIAEGPLSSIRDAEVAISETGIAPERVRSDRKPPLWWDRDGDGGDVLRRTAAAIDRHNVLSAGLRRPDATVVDLTGRFGLDTAAAPGSYRPLTMLLPETVLAGTVAVIAGKLLLLSTADGSVLCDSRKLAGWPLRTTDDPAANLALGTARHLEPQHPTLF